MVFERVIISQHALDVVYGPGTVLTVNKRVSVLSSASSIQEKVSQIKRLLPTLRLKAQCVTADRSLEDINDNY